MSNQPQGGSLPEPRPGGAVADRPDRGLAAEILAGISDGIVALDNEWRLVYANSAVERMWGRELGSLLGKTIHDSLNIPADNPFRLAYMASKESGNPIAFSGYSEIFSTWLEVRGYPHPGGYTILFRDISRDRATPPAILESERKREAARSINQRVFETSLDLILVVDKRGNLVRVSPSAQAIVGYHPDEMVGHSAAEFLYPDDLEGTRSEMRLARRGQSMRNFDCRYVHKDGRVVTLTWTGVWSEPDQQHFFIGRDMTEHLRLEAQLRQAQKMEAIGQLTGGVAHDFNNILAVIVGMIEVLSDGVAADPRLAAAVKMIDQAADRGTQLVQRMLAFARKQSLQAVSLDLNEIVTRMTTLLQRTLGEDITVTTALADGLWTTLADPSQVEDALFNLAVNARDAMPRGGRLVIETANVRLDQNYAEQNLEVVSGDYVALIVTDSGTGMSKEVLDHAFEPFFTTKDVGRGTGLGLSMVYGFVKQSRGHVKIYSEVGHGTSIKLYLPRTVSATAPSIAPSAAGEAEAPGNETVLVVEDDAAVRTVAVSILASLGYDVLEAEDGNTALDLLKSPERIDLLFTDMIMPHGMNGQDLFQRAREHRPNLKVLFTSGYSEQFISGRGDGDPLGPLLGKPYRKKDLAEAVRSALDSRQPNGVAPKR